MVLIFISRSADSKELGNDIFGYAAGQLQFGITGRQRQACEILRALGCLALRTFALQVKEQYKIFPVVTHVIGAFKAVITRDQYGCHCPQ